MDGEEHLKPDNKEELAFVVPTDVNYEQPVSGLTDEMLQRYHDVLHILWKKLFDGLGEFGEFHWTFNMVISKHYMVVEEMWKRNIWHYQPFDSLDEIKYSSYDNEDKKLIVEELSKKEDKSGNISFEPNAINRVKKQ